VGKGQSAACGFNRFEAGQAQNISGRQKANRGGAKGTLGEGAGGAEEGGIVAWGPAASYAAGFPVSLVRNQVF